MARIYKNKKIVVFVCDQCGVQNDGYWTCYFCGRELCEDCQTSGWVRPYGDHRTHCLRCADIGKPFIEQKRVLDIGYREAMRKLSEGWSAAALAVIEAERNQKQENPEP